MPKPAQQEKFRIKLNLLHPNEIPPSLPTRFLRWVISYGRFIVIFTEVIVVGAFVFRFKLDADLDNLKTKINQDLPYVQGLVADEALIKQTQLKLQTIGQGYAATPDWRTIFSDISTQMPTSLELTSLNVESAATDPQFLPIKLNGKTASTNDLGVFIRNLRNAKDDKDVKIFNNISLDSISFDKEEITFTVTGGVKKN